LRNRFLFSSTDESSLSDGKGEKKHKAGMITEYGFMMREQAVIAVFRKYVWVEKDPDHLYSGKFSFRLT
jgi:hypothetical protein